MRRVVPAHRPAEHTAQHDDHLRAHRAEQHRARTSVVFWEASRRSEEIRGGARDGRVAALANVQSYLPVHACTIRPGARSDDSSGETEAEKGETGNDEEKDETIMLAIVPSETHSAGPTGSLPSDRGHGVLESCEL